MLHSCKAGTSAVFYTPQHLHIWIYTYLHIYISTCIYIYTYLYIHTIYYMIYIQYMYHLYPAAKSKKSQDLLGGLRGLHGQRPGQSADRRDHLLGTSTGDHLQPGHRNLGGFQTGNIWGRRENSWKRRLTGDFGRNLGTLYIFFDN